MRVRFPHLLLIGFVCLSGCASESAIRRVDQFSAQSDSLAVHFTNLQHDIMSLAERDFQEELVSNRTASLRDNLSLDQYRRSVSVCGDLMSNLTLYAGVLKNIARGDGINNVSISPSPTVTPSNCYPVASESSRASASVLQSESRFVQLLKGTLLLSGKTRNQFEYLTTQTQPFLNIAASSLGDHARSDTTHGEHVGLSMILRQHGASINTRLSMKYEAVGSEQAEERNKILDEWTALKNELIVYERRLSLLKTAFDIYSSTHADLVRVFDRKSYRVDGSLETLRRSVRSLGQVRR